MLSIKRALFTILVLAGNLILAAIFIALIISILYCIIRFLPFLLIAMLALVIVVSAYQAVKETWKIACKKIR